MVHALEDGLGLIIRVIQVESINTGVIWPTVISNSTLNTMWF